MNRLRELRKQHGLTQDELGQALGVQKAAICKYETGRVPLPNDALMQLCSIFHVTADYILGRDTVTTMFKERGSSSALFMLADENITEYIPLPAGDVTAGDYFYMEVEGDCMIGDFIPEGALVLVRMQNRVESGHIAIVRIGDEVLVRKVKWLNNTLMLIPSNPKYEPMIISGGDVEIIGRVLEVRIRGL